jgi:hypothetical protein
MCEDVRSCVGGTQSNRHVGCRELAQGCSAQAYEDHARGIQLTLAAVVAICLTIIACTPMPPSHPLESRAEPSTAWTAAKAGLPADAKIVVGVDLAALQKSQLFAAFYPKLLEKADASKAIEMMKEICRIDPLAAVQGVVVATSADQEDGAVYLAISGLDKAKVSSCFQNAVQSTGDKDAKVSLKQDGNITEVSDGKKTRFIGWVGNNVIVLSLHREDKPSLVKWMGGKGELAKSKFGKILAKVNTSAAVWGAGEGSKELRPGTTAKGGYGAVTFSKGNLGIDVHAVMEDAAQATLMASWAQGMFDAFRRGMRGPAPELSDMLAAATFVGSSNEVVLKASFAEKELLANNVVPLLSIIGVL